MLLDALMPRRQPSVTKAESGIGAVWMTYDMPLSSAQQAPSKRMRAEQDVALRNWTIRKAESVISERFSTVDWHLEDPDDVEVTDDSPEGYRAIRDLIEKPYSPLKGDPVNATPRTRQQLWSLTCRHMGVCGIAYWYLDGTEALAGTPSQVIYINPARMMPALDNGRLTGWVLDADARGGGTPLQLSEVLAFPLEPSDDWEPRGLVRTVLTQVEIARLADRHVAQTLAAGGRLAGIMGPKGEGFIPDEQFQSLVRDVRNINESPDSAKRVLILRGPTEFTRTAGTLDELKIIDLLERYRDDILALWGVPHSIVGLPAPAGLNSGGTKESDQQIFWQNAVGPRLRNFAETLQFGLLDRYAALGYPVELDVEEPEFDDKAPQFALAAQAQSQPLRNRERRELLGLDPFGDPLLDEAVWMPVGIAELAVAPDAEGNAVRLPPPVLPPAPPMLPPLPMPMLGQGKADLGLPKLRARLEAAMQRDVARVLRQTGRDVAARARRHASHLSQKPSDLSVLLDTTQLEADLERALRPHVEAIAEATTGRVEARLGLAQKAGVRDTVMRQLYKRLGARITGIVGTTRERVLDIVGRVVAQGMADGLGMAALGDRLELALADSGGPFGEYRSEMIARTETLQTLNAAALEEYRALGIGEVQAIDGDDDPECAERNGQTFTLEEAMSIEDHPNGTLDWVPVVESALGG